MTMSTDELAHYGVIGMRWGVRKDRSQPKEELILERKLKGGGKLIVNKNRPPSIVRALSKISPKYKANAEKFQSFTLRNAQGQKVGDAQIHQDTPTSLNLMWIGVKTAHRGNGYASAAVKGVVEYARQNGLKKLTLEVPGDAPDALHIYSKLGFKAVGNVEGSTKDDFWGGLTAMEYLIPDNALSHAAIELQDILQYIEDALNENDPEQKTLSHSKKGDIVVDLSRAQNFVSNLELVQMAPDELAHYGVLGMKWGRRKPESVARDARAERYARNTRRKLAVGTLGASVAIPAAVKAIKRQRENAQRKQSEDHKETRDLLKKKTPELSNKDIQRIVDRLQKERKLSQLNPSKLQRGKKAVISLVAALGTATTVYNFIKSPLGQTAVTRGSAIVEAIMKK